MSSLTEPSVKVLSGVTYKRLIGSYSQNKVGPIFMGIGGMHGNEPAGNIALTRVVQKLQALKPPIKGSFHAFTGNLRALEQGHRFMDKDLNRMWSDDYRPVLDLPILEEPAELIEEAEMHELYRSMVEHAGKNWGNVHVLDLHTTSSNSAPFFIMGDTIRNRLFASIFPVPIVLGIEEQIEGTLSAYLNELGVVGINFEGGQHGDPKSVEAHEAAIWLGLVSAGCMEHADVPEFDHHYRLLETLAKGLPKVFESRYRYAMDPDEEFRMHPGFHNFAHIRKGQELGQSDGQPVKAHHAARIFMPLYQKQGSDGFFLIHRIKPVWLRVSYVLRKLRLDQWLTILPGVRRHHNLPSTLVVNRKIARALSIQLFHLLGYRKVKEVGKLLYVTRRQFDIRSPKKRPL